MAEALEIGHAVYQSYKPLHYGKVVDVRQDEPFPGAGRLHPVYLVRWKDGSEKWLKWMHVRSLENLVADTRRKLGTHEKNLAAAKLL